MKKLSIIIPAFNAEDYIADAINSVYCQGQDEDLFSVIVVNDGSTDSTSSVISGFIKGHSNLYLLNQKNNGVSVARNNGLEYSDADYITFLDADDKFAQASLAQLFAIINREDSDLIILRSYNDTDSVERYCWINVFESDRDYNFNDLYDKSFNRGSACGCIYKSSFLTNNHIFFPEGVAYGEDSIFFALCLIHARKVKFYDVDLYHITTRDNSALTTYNRGKINRFQKSVDYLSTYIKEHSLGFKEGSILHHLKYRLISRCIHDACYAEDMNYYDILRLRWLKSYLPIEMKAIKQQRMEIHLLNKSFSLYCTLAFLKNNLQKIIK